MDAVPLYQSIKESILEKIVSGHYPPGVCLPSEHDFCVEYSVSRMTLRKAMDELCYEGILYRIKGKGTFVSKEKITKPLGQLTSFSNDMRSRGLTPSSLLIEMDIRPADRSVAERFQVMIGTPLAFVQRLRCANGEPMAVESGYYPASVSDFLTPEAVTARSLYEILAENGVVLHKAAHKIEAVNPSSTDVKHLQIASGTPCLLVMRQTFDPSGKVVEVVESVFRGDKYSFFTEVYSVSPTTR